MHDSDHGLSLGIFGSLMLGLSHFFLFECIGYSVQMPKRNIREIHIHEISLYSRLQFE